MYRYLSVVPLTSDWLPSLSMRKFFITYLIRSNLLTLFVEFFYKHAGNPDRDPELTRRVNPNLISFKDFVRNNIKSFVPVQ